jgi:hypothetical protein
MQYACNRGDRIGGGHDLERGPIEPEDAAARLGISGRFPPPRERVERLEEACQLLKGDGRALIRCDPRGQTGSVGGACDLRGVYRPQA